MSSENINKRVQIRLGARRGERGKIINYNTMGIRDTQQPQIGNNATKLGMQSERHNQ